LPESSWKSTLLKYPESFSSYLTICLSCADVIMRSSKMPFLLYPTWGRQHLKCASCNWQCTDSPPHLISDATSPCKMKHFSYSYLSPHQNKRKIQKSLLFELSTTVSKLAKSINSFKMCTNMTLTHDAEITPMQRPCLTWPKPKLGYKLLAKSNLFLCSQSVKFFLLQFFRPLSRFSHCKGSFRCHLPAKMAFSMTSWLH